MLNFVFWSIKKALLVFAPNLIEQYVALTVRVIDENTNLIKPSNNAGERISTIEERNMKSQIE